MRRRSRTLALLLSPVVVSCASGGGSSDFDSYSITVRDDARGYKYTLEASAERIIDALPIVYEYFGFPGGLASNQDGLVFISPTATAEGRIYEEAPNSDFLDCGATVGARQRADTHIVQFAVITRIVPLDAGGTEIEIILDGRARERAQRLNAVPCRGKGKLEGEIAALLRSRVGS